MNSHIGYTITNSIDCHVVFEHTIKDGKRKSYCTVCNKEIKTAYIPKHLLSFKHNVNFYDNYFSLPILDDAYIIKNDIVFKDDIDNKIFKYTTTSRDKSRKLFDELKNSNLDTSKYFKMADHTITNIKLLNVIAPGMKFSKIVFPDNSRIVTEIQWMIIDREHKKKLEEMIKNRQNDDNNELEDEYAVDEYEEEH